jgi:hypothetical protein
MHETQENSDALTEETHYFRLFITILVIDIGGLERIFDEESLQKCCRKSRKVYFLETFRNVSVFLYFFHAKVPGSPRLTLE